MTRRALLSLTLAGLATPLLAATAAAGTQAGEWTGYVTDTHCGAKGASRDHTVQCLDKCMKSGSKAQILAESDHTIHDLDGAAKVRSLVGKRITVKGTLDEKTGVITVTSAAPAGQ
jgi:hypothetical protein